MSGDGQFMRASDAFSWYQDDDPALRSTIVAVVWLDRAPDWNELCARLAAATKVVPRFRQKVQQPPVRLATPRWVTDRNFDLSWHLRRVSAPAPHTAAAVLELARAEAMTGFDRSRPLWTFTLVEQVDGDRAALLMKVHHSLTDGQGAMKLAPTLFDVSPAPHPRPAATAERPLPQPPGNLVLSSVAYDVRRAVERARRGLAAVVPTGLRMLRDPVGSASALLATVRSIADTVAPVATTLSPVMRDRGPGRGLELVCVNLADLKRAAAAGDGTVNDAFLAGITGGLRRYHELHGAPAERLRVTMPVSIRAATDSWASNRITLMRFALPVAQPDPAARMAEIHRSCRQAASAPSLPYTDAIAEGLDLLPSVVTGSMLKRIDFLASDVTGIETPIYLAGATVTAYFAFGPTMGSSANLTLLSYHGVCHIGVTRDTAAIPDADQFAECLRAGFEEVLALAGPHSSVWLPVRDGVFPGTTEPRPATRVTARKHGTTTLK